MGLFRSLRSIAVNRRQCTRAETIATDREFSNVMPGDWVIHGEGSENYILSNEFVQRTFALVEEQRLTCESQGAPKQGHSVGSKTLPNLSRRITGRRARVHRTHGLDRPARKLSLPIHSIHKRRGLSDRSENFAHVVFAAMRTPKANHSI
jgi:hypothetical protein